jgi:sugar-phosphatase
VADALGDASRVGIDLARSAVEPQPDDEGFSPRESSSAGGERRRLAIVERAVSRIREQAGMSAMSAAAFLFDMDGTLIDSHRAMLRIWGRWAKRRGLDFATLLPTIHGVRAVDTMRRLGIPGLDPVAEALVIEREEVEDVEGVAPIAGAIDFLAALPPERWTVVTSAPPALAKARLGAAGIAAPDTLVSGGDVVRGKPAPDCWLLGAKRLGFEASDCIVFEDSAAGVQSAITSGAGLVVIASAQATASPSGRFTITDYGQLELTVGRDRLSLRPRRIPANEPAAAEG